MCRRTRHLRSPSRVPLVPCIHVYFVPTSPSPTSRFPILAPWHTTAAKSEILNPETNVASSTSSHRCNSRYFPNVTFPAAANSSMHLMRYYHCWLSAAPANHNRRSSCRPRGVRRWVQVVLVLVFCRVQLRATLLSKRFMSGALKITEVVSPWKAF